MGSHAAAPDPRSGAPSRATVRATVATPRERVTWSTSRLTKCPESGHHPTIRPGGRSTHFRIFLVPILKLRRGQPVESGRMLIQQPAGLEMQFTAEQFAYRAFHAREIRIIGLRLASPIVIFFCGQKLCALAPRDAVYHSVLLRSVLSL